MRAFHMAWSAFFLAFFGWFGIAPLMVVVRDDLGLTQTQIGNTIIASVLITALVRVAIGPLCDRLGPRRTYSALLMLGALPVMGIGLAQSYETFLVMRLLIGGIGAAFVITQYHTSSMFAPNVVGTANAVTAGWGNLGGGVTQMAMPLVFSAMVMLGVSESLGWRLAMIVPGVALFAMGIAYRFLTQDAPDGDLAELRANAATRAEGGEEDRSDRQATWAAVKDVRVWSLFLIYGSCFGAELTMNNVAALYFHDRFELSLTAAGLIAGTFGTMNLFTRALGGLASDRMARVMGLSGRVAFLGAVLAIEGVVLMAFSQMASLVAAVAAMILCSLFVQAASGATYGVVPFMHRRALGTVAGIVGAGGNAGAVAAGFLFRSESIATADAFFYMGAVVTVCSALVLVVRFSPSQERSENRAFHEALAERSGAARSEVST